MNLSQNDDLLKWWLELEAQEAAQAQIGTPTDPIYKRSKFSGVRQGLKIKSLSHEVGIERNLMKAPLCVPNPKTAKASTFIYDFTERNIKGQRINPQVIIISRGGIPLPLPQHARVLDILLAMFVTNFNDQGQVWFSYNDISKLLGNCLTQNTMIKEAITRYHNTAILFKDCWGTSHGFISVSLSIIKKVELNSKGGPKNKKENLHCVVLAQEIVESVKNNFIRLFPNDAFSELDAGSYTLYKLFYAPTDREPVCRTIGFIARFLAWSERTDRLHLWLVKHLEILKKGEFILWWQKDGDYFEVCSNPARFKRKIAEMRRLDPMKAERAKAKTLLETRKQAKLQGAKVEIQTQQAVLNLQTNLKDKTKDDFEKVFELRQGENILEQLADMSSQERELFFKMMKDLPAQDRDCFISSKLDNFLES